MRFVDELARHFFKVMETAAVAAMKTMGLRDLKFIEAIVHDNPGVIPVTGN